MKIEIRNYRTFDYRGIKGFVQQRYINGVFCDWGYKISGGVAGIGQGSEDQAYEDAKWAIDYQLDGGSDRDRDRDRYSEGE